MAATIVRLRGNSYRLPCRKVKLSCHCLCLQERFDPFRYHLNIVFIHTSRRNKHAQYFCGPVFASSFFSNCLASYTVQACHCHVPFILLSQGLPHDQRQAEPNTDISPTPLGRKYYWSHILLGIYIHAFGQFRWDTTKHAKQCPPVLIATFLKCKCYSAQLVKYLKQCTVRDAHTHTHTYILARAHLLYHTHMRSTLA